MREGRKRPVSIAHLCRVLASGAWAASACRVCANFVPDLTAELAATKLAMRLKAVVPVDANHASIEHCPIERVHGQCGLLSRRIFHEAEAAWLHFHSVEAHDQIDYLAAS